jgi:hypothetical protein
MELIAEILKSEGNLRMNNILPDLFVIPDYDNAKVTIKFTAPQGCSDIQWTIMSRTDIFSRGVLKNNHDNKISFDIDMSNFKSWTPDYPNLYTLEMILSSSYNKLQIKENFGMRKFSITNNQIFLNNKPIYIRGYIRGRDAHDHPNFLGLSSKEFYKKNILAAKNFGFNFVRFHSRVPSESFFQAADELGILAQIELRNYDSSEHDNFLTDQGEMLDKKKWIDTIQALRNHPSLMIYCMGCEMPGNGADPYALEIYNLVKLMDPTRIFLDTCARGEFDRTTTDIEVQHMSYFFPFGKNHNMFENCNQWSINGSVQNLELSAKSQNCLIERNLSTEIPIIAHEICHYVALRDIKKMERNFQLNKAEKPWWLDEVKKLVQLKNLENDYPDMLAASKHFQALSWKLGIEAARRSKLLCGFHILQLADTDKYENSNGLLDCFDDPQTIPAEDFKKFNNSAVLLADLPRRTFFENEIIKIPVILSHFDANLTGYADLTFELINKANNEIIVSGKMKKFDLNKLGREEISQISLNLPAAEKAKACTIRIKLDSDAKHFKIENSWDIWLYPNKPQNLAPLKCTVTLDEINLKERYPQIISDGSIEKPQHLLIVNRFKKEVIAHLKNGGDVLVLYRIPETRDRKIKAKKEKYYLPTTWDRFKATIWDRGTNCGGFIRPNNVLNNFPNQRFIDFQFAGLIDDCDKMVMDDFPCPIEPIIQGVDKAVRDRFDVHTFKLGTLQPKWTLRKFAYMFELKVGKGRLFITGFNFTRLNENQPEVCAMFESIIEYVISNNFNPKASIEPDIFEKYLLQKGAEPRIKERKMTQFWQLDEEPLESELYWKQAEEYINSPD